MFNRLIKNFQMIKDMHVTFINYVESLWTQVAVNITDSWNRMLQVVEPAFIEFVHYVDSLFWDYSKKIVGKELTCLFSVFY